MVFAVSRPSSRTAQAVYSPGYVIDDDQRDLVRELAANAGAFEPSGKLAPRLVAAFSDAGTHATGMGPELRWSGAVRSLRDRLSNEAGHPFNYALVNWYRGGSDFVGWHADKVDLHEPGSQIAIVSLGAERPIYFRRIGRSEVAFSALLERGSVLWMTADLQREYEHSLPADDDVVEERFSLTFRWILPAAAT